MSWKEDELNAFEKRVEKNNRNVALVLIVMDRILISAFWLTIGIMPHVFNQLVIEGNEQKDVLSIVFSYLKDYSQYPFWDYVYYVGLDKGTFVFMSMIFAACTAFLIILVLKKFNKYHDYGWPLVFVRFDYIEPPHWEDLEKEREQKKQQKEREKKQKEDESDSDIEAEVEQKWWRSALSLLAPFLDFIITVMLGTIPFWIWYFVEVVIKKGSVFGVRERYATYHSAAIATQADRIISFDAFCKMVEPNYKVHMALLNVCVVIAIGWCIITLIRAIRGKFGLLTRKFC